MQHQHQNKNASNTNFRTVSSSGVTADCLESFLRNRKEMKMRIANDEDDDGAADGFGMKRWQNYCWHHGMCHRSIIWSWLSDFRSSLDTIAHHNFLSWDERDFTLLMVTWSRVNRFFLLKPGITFHEYLRIGWPACDKWLVEFQTSLSKKLLLRQYGWTGQLEKSFVLYSHMLNSRKDSREKGWEEFLLCFVSKDHHHPHYHDCKSLPSLLCSLM